jgi:hypothetical protein
MKPIEFDWKKDTTSIVWEEPTCGIIRFHVPGDANEHPQYRGVCFVKIGYRSSLMQRFIRFLQKLNLGGHAEFKAMVTKDGMPATKIEHRNMKNLLSDMGFELVSRRLKNGKVIIKRY